MRELAPDAESTDGPRLGGSNSAGPRDGKDDGLTPVTEDGPYDGPRLGGSSSVGPQDERETGRRPDDETQSFGGRGSIVAGICQNPPTRRGRGERYGGVWNGC